MRQLGIQKHCSSRFNQSAVEPFSLSILFWSLGYRQLMSDATGLEVSLKDFGGELATIV